MNSHTVMGDNRADEPTIVSDLLPQVIQGPQSTGARLLNPPAQPQPAINPSPFLNTPQASQLQQAVPDDPFVGCERYVRGRYLGKGGSGQVYSAWDQVDQEHVAVKFLEAHNVHHRYLEREVINHRGLDHPHIIRFKEVIATQRYIGIVMELANDGNLHEYVQRVSATGVPEPLARWMFQQIVLAVDYCHSRGIANRDLKLGNVLLHLPSTEDGLPVPVIKLCDFGYSRSDTQSVARSRVGTVFYMAPEVVNCTAGASYDSKVADIWSCGVMLYRMLFNRWPFAQSKLKDTLEQITQMAFVIPDAPAISDECKHLLRRMLTHSTHRITLQQIQQHPWFLTGITPEVVAWNQSLIVKEVNEAELQPIQDIQEVLQGALNPPATVPNLEEIDHMFLEAEREELQRSLDIDLPSF